MSTKGAGRMMKPAERAEFFRILRAANPEPRSELEYATPYELLVAVVLSAQATDRSVNLATCSLYPVANTPAKMVALGEERLREFIKTIGLFRTKAKNVIALSRLLLEEHAGQVPRTREALERLPGVGRKTANVVLNVAFGEPTMAVDTHIFRVANRTGLAPGKDPLAVERKLLEVVPEEFRPSLAHPARPLHLPRAVAAMRRLPGLRALRIQGQGEDRSASPAEAHAAAEMSLFNPSRDQVREFFFGLWEKSRARQALTPLETMALAIVMEHPEYHEVLGNPESPIPSCTFPCISPSRSRSRSTSRRESALP